MAGPRLTGMHIPAGTRAVLYDLDGTLVDHDHAARAGVDAWCAELGLPDGQWDRWRDIERRWFTRFEQGRVSHLGQRIERCREFLGCPDLSDEEALALYERYLTVYRASWRAFDDALPSLTQALSLGLHVGILTNGAEPMQRRKLEATGLWLDGMVMLATVELGAPKPSPKAYSGAMSALGVGAGETVMIGDSWPNDVAGPRRAGMSAIYLLRDGVARERHVPRDEPVVSSLEQIVWE